MIASRSADDCKPLQLVARCTTRETNMFKYVLALIAALSSLQTSPALASWVDQNPQTIKTPITGPDGKGGLGDFYSRKVFDGTLNDLRTYLDQHRLSVKVKFYGGPEFPLKPQIGRGGKPWASCVATGDNEPTWDAAVVCVAIDKRGRPLDRNMDNETYNWSAVHKFHGVR